MAKRGRLHASGGTFRFDGNGFGFRSSMATGTFDGSPLLKKFIFDQRPWPQRYGFIAACIPGSWGPTAGGQPLGHGNTQGFQITAHLRRAHFSKRDCRRVERKVRDWVRAAGCPGALGGWTADDRHSQRHFMYQLGDIDGTLDTLLVNERGGGVLFVARVTESLSLERSLPRRFFQRVMEKRRDVATQLREFAWRGGPLRMRQAAVKLRRWGDPACLERLLFDVTIPTRPAALRPMFRVLSAFRGIERPLCALLLAQWSDPRARLPAPTVQALQAFAREFPVSRQRIARALETASKRLARIRRDAGRGSRG